MNKIMIDTDKCIGCGQCVKDCVSGCLHIAQGKAEANSAGCIGCGHCYAVCPVQAVSIPGMQTDNGEMHDMSELDSHVLLQAMKSRRSVRRFRPDPVEPEKLEMILEAGRCCPTAANSQDVAYTVLGSRQDEIEALCLKLFRTGAGAAGKLSALVRSINIDDHFFFKGAPLVIVVSGRSSGNANLASSYMELMAESLGLGVLYSGFFVICSRISAKIHRMLNLPLGYHPVTCMVIGYPDVKYHRIPGRKPIRITKL